MGANANRNRAAALRLLQHYFELFMQGGRDWAGDNAAETEDLLDYIIDAAADRAIERWRREQSHGKREIVSSNHGPRAEDRRDE